MIDILVVFDNANFSRTRINCTLLEAKEYYQGNYFNFGTSEENESKARAVNVFLYDQWKSEVLKYCMENNSTVLNFDDHRQLMTFKTDYNDYVTLTYEKVNNAMKKYPVGYKVVV